MQFNARKLNVEAQLCMLSVIWCVSFLIPISIRDTLRYKGPTPFAVIYLYSKAEPQWGTELASKMTLAIHDLESIKVCDLSSFHVIVGNSGE
jgi:hypothetical protein